MGGLITGYDLAYEGNDDNIEARYLMDDDRIEADIVILGTL